MNCCDYDCNQGRDCPARVARIGRKDHARAELTPTTWRNKLRRAAQWMLVAICVLFYAALLSAVVSNA